MVVSSSTRKLIEGTPWSRRHFYLGLDLTIYFLAACMINVCDLAKDHTRLCADGREFSYGEEHRYTSSLLDSQWLQPSSYRNTRSRLGFRSRPVRTLWPIWVC